MILYSAEWLTRCRASPTRPAVLCHRFSEDGIFAGHRKRPPRLEAARGRIQSTSNIYHFLRRIARMCWCCCLERGHRSQNWVRPGQGRSRLPGSELPWHRHRSVISIWTFCRAHRLVVITLLTQPEALFLQSMKTATNFLYVKFT